jgi:hypothetical protein
MSTRGTRAVHMRAVCAAHRLPDDLVGVVVRMWAVGTVQRWYRVWIYRHASHACWPFLRATLLDTISVQDFDALQRNPRVRFEWRSEPSSWCTTAGDASDIVLEVREGLWVLL